jgi:glycosyltransferase involved in cell wall biosynthesis
MADYILAVSNSVKKFLTQFQLKTQIDVLNPCIDIKYEGIYKPIGSKIVIGTMAVIRRKKNIKCLLQAFALLKKREVPFQGIIAGRGYSILWLKLLSKKDNISDNIIFKPWVTDKEKFFNEIDIYCVTSNKETFNISLIEAMAHKKYVISIKCGGPEEIIVQNKTGYLIPINDYTELAKHIEFLRGNPDKMARSVINGYNRVTDLYNFDTCVIKLKKYINSTSVRSFRK